MPMTRHMLVIALLSCLLPALPHAQVTAERLANAAQEPQNWLTYSGTYVSHRYSTLSQLDPANVADLEMKWVFQSRTTMHFQATPLVVDGIMYLTQPPNDIVALDAKSGRVFWVYEHVPSPEATGGRAYRGLAILDDMLFMGTIDAMVVAVDAKNGGPLWSVQVADAAAGYSINHAPLVIKDKVIVGMSGGDRGIRGFIAAYEASTGREVWRFHTIPAPGEPGHETWEPCTPDLENCDPEAWKTGGGAVWLTGSYDPETNLTFWGVGNPGPDYSYYQRPGDNLYASSVVALDADTGELDWYFQFTPGDRYDYDAVQIPVLVDLDVNGTTVKAMRWANRNGFFYVLDRVTGRFLTGHPFVRLNWASGLDDSGGGDSDATRSGCSNLPRASKAARTGIRPRTARGRGSCIFQSGKGTPQSSTRRRWTTRPDSCLREAATGAWSRECPSHRPSGGVISTHGRRTSALERCSPFNPVTGDKVWQWKTYDVINSGILTTATDLLFVGGREGYFQALDARSGDVLWRAVVGGNTLAAPITYEVDGRQYVAIASGHSLYVFGLRN